MEVWCHWARILGTGRECARSRRVVRSSILSVSGLRSLYALCLQEQRGGSGVNVIFRAFFQKGNGSRLSTSAERDTEAVYFYTWQTKVGPPLNPRHD